MLIRDTRSGTLASDLLSLSGLELRRKLGQLASEDLAAAWAAMPPWGCALVWQRYRGTYVDTRSGASRPKASPDAVDARSVMGMSSSNSGVSIGALRI